MNLAWEVAANAVNAVSIFLAGRNSVHTWWTGIVGCLLFARVYFAARLYADVTLQAFFVATSVAGWWQWKPGATGDGLPVQRTPWPALAGWFLAGLGVTAGYGALLWRLTNAAAPFIDSAVLAFSVLGQFLLVRRRYESWWCWLLVNTVSVPLYASRGLWVTAALYVVFWINALVALRHWRRLSAGTVPGIRT